MPKKTYLFILFVVVASFSAGAYLYPDLPDKMASHWNVKGEVDGYMPKFWGVFLMPLVAFGIFVLFLILPKIDPLKENYKKFRKYFDGFITLIVLFLLYIHVISLYWNLGGRFNMSQLMSPAVAVLLYYAGILIQHAKRNWFVGIRTPWTLSSDKVWEETHAVGAKLFKASAIIALLGLVFPDKAIFFMAVPAIFSAIYTFVFSYFSFRKNPQ